MKTILYLFLFLPVLLFAQPRYGVEGIPLCWSISGTDSSIVRYVIISSTGKPVKTIAYENAAGSVITVAGGTIRYGYCDCGTGTGGNGIYGGSGVLPEDTVEVENTNGIRFAQPGTANGMLITNRANGAAGIALDPVYTDSIRQGLIWKQGLDSAAVGIDKDGNLQMVSNGWVVLGNEQAKIIIRKDDGVILIKTSGGVYALADGSPLAGKNNVMFWPSGSASGRFVDSDSLIDARLKVDTTVLVESVNYFPDVEILNPAARYNNIYMVCKGATDTARVAFLFAPSPYDEYKGVTYHVVADSGIVYLYLGAYGSLSNSKSSYYLEKGQRAEVRGLYDFTAGVELWKVDVVWDSLENIYTTNGTIPEGEYRYIYFGDPTGDSYKYFYGDPTYAEESTYGYLNNDGYFYFGGWSGVNQGGSRPRYAYTNTAAYISNVGGSILAGANYFTPYSSSSGVARLTAYSARTGVDTVYSYVSSYADSVQKAAGSVMSVVGKTPYAGYYVHHVGLVQGNIANAQGAFNVNLYNNNRHFQNTSLTTFSVQTANNTGTPNHKWFSITDMDNLTANRAAISLYNNSYTLPNFIPSATANAISSMIWTAGVPTFLRSQHGTTSGTTDASGDITVTIPAMTDATYEVQLTLNGTTYYGLSYHTLTTTTFKIRAFDGTHAAVGAGINLMVAYDLKDY